MKHVLSHLVIAALLFFLPSSWSYLTDRLHSPIAGVSPIAIPAKLNQPQKVKAVGQEEASNKIDCTKRKAYDFIEDEDSVAIYTNVVRDGKVLSRIVFRKGPNNFRLNSIVRTAAGLDIKADWGGGVYHYEIQFSFLCANNNFYLFRVNKDSFSTADPESGSFLDQKKREVIKVKPRVPIQKFVLSDYL
jgi:hypothetical protein